MTRTKNVNKSKISNKLAKRRIRISIREFPNKIPEAVEKTAERTLRENIIANTTDALLDALNSMIEKHDLTFEEALHASDILHLSIIAKYIDFRLDTKFEEALEKFSTREDRRAGIA